MGQGTCSLRGGRVPERPACVLTLRDRSTVQRRQDQRRRACAGGWEGEFSSSVVGIGGRHRVRSRRAPCACSWKRQERQERSRGGRWAARDRCGGLAASTTRRRLLRFLTVHIYNFIYIYKSRAPLLPPVPAAARAGLGRLAIWSSQHRAGSPASASPNPGADPSSGARALQLQALGETPSCGVFFLRLRPTLCWSHMFVVCHLLLPPAPRAPPHAPTHASCSVTALSGCSDGWCRGRRDRGIAADILVSRTPDFVSGIKMHTHFCALCLN